MKGSEENRERHGREWECVRKRQEFGLVDRSGGGPDRLVRQTNGNVVGGPG